MRSVVKHAAFFTRTRGRNGRNEQNEQAVFPAELTRFRRLLKKTGSPLQIIWPKIFIFAQLTKVMTPL